MNRRFFPVAVMLLLAAGCSSTDDSTTGANTNLTSPSDLSLVRIGKTAVAISWKDNSNSESGFQIDRSVVGGVFAPVHYTSQNVNSVVDSTGLKSDSTYYYRVWARRYSEVSTDPTAVDSITFTLPYP